MAIFSAIGSAIAGALFAGSTLAATVISGGLAFAANIGIQYLKRPKKRTYSAVQGETQYGGDVSAQTLYGTGKTKGQRIFYAKWDKGNKWNADVFVLANGWCDGLEPYVYVHGEKKDLVVKPKIGGEVARYFVEDYIDDHGDGVLQIRFYDGRPGQAVDQRLVDVTANLGKKWKATSVNAGLCYVVVERYYADKFFGEKGKPEIEFVLRGLREYDPRKDSTVAGGSGAQRLNNPATWVHTQNPAVHRLNYQLGLKAMISGRTLIGEGKTLGQIDLATYFLSMNVCDQVRTDGKKRYQCSLFVTGEDDHTEILKEFDDAMAGFGLNRRGLSGVIPGAPQIPVLEITADDIPADRAKDVQFRKSAFDRYNHLSGQFTSIESMWNPESLKPIYVNADIAADGRNRQASNDFLQVTDPDLAQYLLSIRYRQNRRGGTATLPVSRRVGLRVQEGEWVVWRGKEWMISEWIADEQFRFTLKLTETGADIYDDEDIEPGPIVIPPTPPVNPSMLSTVQNFAVDAWSVQNEAGYRAPALRFRWLPPEDPTIVAVRVEYRMAGSTETLRATSNDPEGGELVITTNVVPGAVYEARATITTVPDRLKTWTPWATTDQATTDLQIILDYLAGEIRQDLIVLNDWIASDLLGTATQTAAALIAETQARVIAIQAQADALAAEAQMRAEAIGAQADALAQEQAERIAAIIEQAARYRDVAIEIAALRDYVANNDFAQFEKVEQLRIILTARIGEVVATYDERITVAASETASLAQRTTTLEASTADLNAQVLSVQVASVNRDNALASRMDALSAGTDNQFDPMKMWGFDATTLGWTGDVQPTVSNGYLRPGDSSAPYVVSPTGLGADPNMYRQIRARIRKTGNPVWEGQAWWNGIADFIWDDARRVSIEAPSFDAHGLANVTFDMPWAGSVDQIRIDLSTAQTATDYFEFDWISIGSPSPGASRAELLAEQSARASGDSANAQAITALQALFQDVNGDVTAIATGLSTITTSVENLEDAVTAQSQQLTSLGAQVAGKASASALALLAVEVDALNGGNGVVIQGQSTTALRNELNNLLAEVNDQQFAAFLGQQDVRNALTTASQTLTTRIEATNDSVALVSEAVTQLQAALPGKADATALQALQTRVTVAEGTIASSSSAITALQNALPGKADASALQSLASTVTQQGEDISAQAEAIGELQVSVASKASASALSSLAVTVSQQGTTLTSQGNAITGLQNALPGKADASALQSLSTTVTQQGNTIGSQGQAIVTVQNALPGKADASALQALSNVVSQHGDALSSQSSAITGLQNGLNDKASASALNSLATTVAQQGNAISAQASSLSSLSATVDGKASIDYANAILGIVNDHGGQINAQASALTALSATVGGLSADARLKFEVVAGPSGYSRIGARARFDTNSDYREAAWYLDVPADPANPTQFLVAAQRFAVIDPVGVQSYPFVYEGGVLKLAIAHIQTLLSGTINFGNGRVIINSSGITVTA